jgi:hypothetical protein
VFFSRECEREVVDHFEIFKPSELAVLRRGFSLGSKLLAWRRNLASTGPLRQLQV